MKMTPPNQMSFKIALQISCSGLLGSDAISASDPLVVVEMKDKVGKFHEIGRTERMKNENNPKFNKTIEVDYYFEEIQTLKFSVYAKDNDTNSTDNDDELGEIVLTLGQIVAAKEVTENLSKQNLTSSIPSTITIAPSVESDIDEMKFVIHGSNLDKKDFLGKSDPYLHLCKRIGDKFITIHKTETIKDTKKPHWAPFSVCIQNLCGGNFDTTVLFQVFDYDSSGSHSLIGECEVELSQLKDANPSPVLDLINQKKKSKKKDYKNSGKLTILQCEVVKKYSFLDYIFGGCQINFTCGIDFTGSNGDPRHSSSLHYMGRVNPNEYSQAIQAIGNVLQYYDSDQLYPAFGFGAKIPPSKEVSHDFPLNFNVENPYCTGIQGILSAYSNAICQVKLWGPTNIAPIINQVTRYAGQSQTSNKAVRKYFILLLITDGVITDMDATREAIVNASHLPMSVVIVGVGNADFTAMRFLDSDKTLLRSPSGETAARDIVQFVPFRNFKMVSAAALASKVLAEIPKQVVEYFSSKNFAPIFCSSEENHVQNEEVNRNL